MPHYCHSANIEIIDGDSAWNARHGLGQWTGPIIPFGAKVVYRPTPHHAKDQQKFEPNGRFGIFLGYHLLNGCKWKRNGGLLVCDLEHTFGADRDQWDPFDTAKHWTLQRVSEADYDREEGVVFPLKRLFDFRQQEVVYMPIDNKKAFDLPLTEGDKEDTDSGAPAEQNAVVEGGNADDAPVETGADAPAPPEEGENSSHAGRQGGLQWDDGGRNARRKAGTGRPPAIWPEVWKEMMSP